jgi:hypothetical protein
MRSCSAVHAMITHFSLETFQLRLCMRLSFFFVNHVRPEWKICCLPIVVGLEQTVMAVTHRIEQRFLYSSLRIALTSKDEECTWKKFACSSHTTGYKCGLQCSLDGGWLHWFILNEANSRSICWRFVHIIHHNGYSYYFVTIWIGKQSDFCIKPIRYFSMGLQLPRIGERCRILWLFSVLHVCRACVVVVVMQSYNNRRGVWLESLVNMPSHMGSMGSKLR